MLSGKVLSPIKPKGMNRNPSAIILHTYIYMYIYIYYTSLFSFFSSLIVPLFYCVALFNHDQKCYSKSIEVIFWYLLPNGAPNFKGYLMPKSFLGKNSRYYITYNLEVKRAHTILRECNRIYIYIYIYTYIYVYMNFI